MAEKDNEFTGGLIFKTTNCPECGKGITREGVENNLSHGLCILLVFPFHKRGKT